MMRACAFAVVSLLLRALAGVAAPQPASEADVKAAYVLNFIKLVEWPAESFATPDAPIVVAVLGHGPLAESLPRLFAGRDAQKRRLVVTVAATAREAAAAHVVVVPTDVSDSLGDDLGGLVRKGVLTVGDADDFLERGGGIRFVVEDSRLRFHVSLAATDRAGLKLSSSLLSLARVVGDRGKGAR